MGLNILKLFVSGREKRSIIGLLLIQSVVIGIYYSIFNITAHATFLSRFDETDMARAYFFSGLLGAGLTFLYSFLQSRMRFSLLSVLNMVFILILTAVMWILVRFAPEPWVFYLFFMLLGPLFILTVMGLRGTSTRIFKGLEEQRTSGVLNSALISGFIIGSFIIPVLLPVIYVPDMLIISAVSIIVAFLIQLDIIKGHKQNLLKNAHPEHSETGLKVFLNKKYIRLLGIFFALSVAVLFFVQYSFMAVTRVRYPSEFALARFLGFFEGSMMILALIINVFLFSRIIKRQGTEIALAISPVLIGLFTIVAIALGSTGEISGGTPGFLVFFLIMAFSRIFSRSMNISVERPALNILSQPLGENLRHSVKSAIDGRINEIAVLATGLLLTGIGALTFVKLIHFSWVLLLLIVAWGIVALRLYKSFRFSIKKSLDEEVFEQTGYTQETEKGNFKTAGSAGLFISNNYFDLITSSDIHENISDNRLMLKQVINKAEQHLNPDMLPLLRHLMSGKYGNNGLGERLHSVLKGIESGLEKEGFGKRKDLVSTIEESSNRKMHLQAIMAQQAPPVVTDLMRLIRDEDDDIRRETIYIAGKFRIRELLPEICECLDNEHLARDAYSVLRSFGEEAFPALSRHFFRSSGNIMVRRLIVRLFAETGGKKATDFLLPRLWSVHRLLRQEAVRGLEKCGYKTDDNNRERINHEILYIVGLLKWNLSAQLILKENDDNLLYENIDKDSEWWLNLLYDMLTLSYEKNAVQRIRENLEHGTVVSVSFALELLDMTVEEGIKPQLKALFDQAPTRIKLKNLSRFYPGDLPDYKTLVTELVNKDYNHIGVWTKVCSLRRLYELTKPAETDFLVALLFGVHRILREESCRYLQDNYDDVYRNCSYRLPKLYRDQLDEILDNHIKDNELVYIKLLSLLQFFPGIPENILISMAEKIKLLNKIEDSLPEPGTDFIIWPAASGNNELKDSIYFNWHTAGHTFDTEKLRGESGVYYVLYMKDIENFVFYEPEYSSLVVNYIDSILSEIEQRIKAINTF